MSSLLLRPPRREDVAAIAELYERTYGDFRPTDAEEIRQWLDNEELQEDWLRVLDDGGRVVGYGDVWIQDDEVALDVAAPGHWSPFVDWAEEHARRVGADRVRVWFPEGHELEQVLGACGYAYWRSSFTMEIDLSARPDALDVPAGLAIRTYRGGDAEALRLSLNEAFAEDPFFHAVSPANFQAFYVQSRGFDPTLWFLAWDGADLAGSALAYPCRGSDDTLGWIGTLSVRRQWRGRGLAKALLRAAFGELYDRGFRRAGLGVDAQNATGAVQLYESVGMRKVRRGDNWTKSL
jgi:ribosomal protein S18 acetylase RimI-like enzyme